MTERRSWSLSRALLAALLVLLGLVAPQVAVAPASAAPPSAVGTATAVDESVLRAELTADLEAYLAARGGPEHVSAAGLSVDLLDRPSSIDVSAGTMTLGGSEPVQPDALWQIGSHAKAFTAVLLLQLEAEHRLSIDDALGTWLPQYPEWGDVPIRRLLNMTSGIPSYDRQPAFHADYVADPLTHFSAEQLVGYAAGVPATSGYAYSNTNYVLAEMVIEQVTGRSYADELYDRLLEPLCLRDTHYREHLYPDSVTSRLPPATSPSTRSPGWPAWSGGTSVGTRCRGGAQPGASSARWVTWSVGSGRSTPAVCCRRNSRPS